MKSLQDLLSNIPKKEEDQNLMSKMPEQQLLDLQNLSQNNEPQSSQLKDNTSSQTPKDTGLPMSKSEALIAEYNKLLGENQEDLVKARERDKMLKIGGAIGDALATYINAQGQKRVMAPGVQVQQGAGLGKVAEMFSTAPEIASDLAQKREAMLKQYAELAKGERAQARITAEKEMAKDRMTHQEKLTKAEIDARLEAARIGASGKKGFTPYQENQIKEAKEKEVRSLGTEITKSGLPRLVQSIKSLESQLGIPLEEVLKRNTDEDKTNDIEVPGYGFLTSALPDKALNQKARDFRQAAQNIFNPEISSQFGASQTAGEVERFQKASGSGMFEREATTLKGLLAIKKAAQADLEAISAGYSPETIQTYQDRKGVNLQNTPEVDPRIELFMKQNNITDRDEAIRILKEEKKI